MSALPQAEPSVIESDGKATFPVPKSGRRPAKMPDNAQEIAAEPGKEAHEVEQTPEPRQETRNDQKGPKWVSKDQWQGDPDDWVGEKEFRKRQELYDAVSQSNKKARETDAVVSELREHNRKMADALRKATLGDKLKEREEAIVSGDKERVYAIEREMQETHAAIPQIAPEAPRQPPVHPDIQAWADKNAWFRNDPELHHMAIGIHEAQLRSNDGRSLPELLEDVTAQVRKRYPERFGGKPADEDRQVRRGSVETPSTTRLGGKKHFRFSDLNETQQMVCKKFVRKGVMTEQQYIDDLQSIGELK